MTYEHIYDEQDMRRFNQHAGYHFFDRDTMKFFKSRVNNIEWKYDKNGTLHILFSTSESSIYTPNVREHSLHELARDGSVKTLVKRVDFPAYIRRLMKLSYERIISETQN